MLEELDLVDVDGIAGKRLEEELDVARRGDDGRPVDPVVGEPGEVLLGEPRLEEDVVACDPMPDERAVRVLAALDEHLVVDQVVVGRRLFLRVPGEQVGDRPRARILGREIEGNASPVECRERLLETEADILVPHECRDRGRSRGAGFQALPDERLEGAVRRDLENHLRAVVPADRLHRGPEADGLPDVGPPVPGVQALRRPPGDRGHHGHVGREPAPVQEGEGRHDVAAERVHGGRVEGDVPGDQPVLEPAVLEGAGDGLEGGLPPADDSVRRRVLAGDLHPGGSVTPGPEWDADLLEETLHPRPVEADRKHPPRAGHPLLQRGAVVDQMRGVRERERPAGVGRGDLARAVSHHAVGMHAPGREELGESALDHEDRGLGQPDLVQLLLTRGEAGLPEGDRRVAPPLLLHGVDHAAEDRIGVVERAPASGPLRSLSGEHHRHPGLALFGGAHGRGVLDEGVERVGELSAVPDGEGGPRREPAPAPPEIAGQGVEVDPPVVECLAEEPCALGQGAGRACREGNHVPGTGSRRHRPDPGSLRSVFPDDAVAVGPAEPEGIDPDHDRTVGEGLADGLHLHRAAVEVDLQVRRQEVLRDGGEGASPHHHDDLEQRAGERRRFQVSDVALHAGDAERSLALDAPVGLGDGVPFDAVAHDGAGRVRLDVVEVPRVEPCPRSRGAHHLDL